MFGYKSIVPPNKSVTPERLNYRKCSAIFASSPPYITVDFGAKVITIPKNTFIIFTNKKMQNISPDDSVTIDMNTGFESYATFLVIDSVTLATRLVRLNNEITATEYVILEYYSPTSSVNSDTAVKVITGSGEIILHNFSEDIRLSNAVLGYISVGTLNIDTVNKKITYTAPGEANGRVNSPTRNVRGISTQELDYSAQANQGYDYYIYIDTVTKNLGYALYSVGIKSPNPCIVLLVATLTGTVRWVWSSRNIRINNLPIPNAPTKLPFAGLNWCAYGDSITNNDTWKNYVVNALGFANLYDLGWSDSAVTMEDKTLYINPDGTYNSNPITTDPQPAGTVEVQCSYCHDDRIAFVPLDSDVITVMGGTNDLIRNKPIGTTDFTIVDGVKKYDNTTFTGALCETIQKLQARVPNALIVLMTPPAAVLAAGSSQPKTNSIGLTIVDYVKACKEVALHMGCPIIDTHQCGITLENSALTLNDTVHPSTAGYKLLARCVIGGLKNMAPLEL